MNLEDSACGFDWWKCDLVERVEILTEGTRGLQVDLVLIRLHSSQNMFCIVMKQA